MATALRVLTQGADDGAGDDDARLVARAQHDRSACSDTDDGNAADGRAELRRPVHGHLATAALVPPTAAVGFAAGSAPSVSDDAGATLSFIWLWDQTSLPGPPMAGRFWETGGGGNLALGHRRPRRSRPTEPSGCRTRSKTAS